MVITDKTTIRTRYYLLNQPLNYIELTKENMSIQHGEDFKKFFDIISNESDRGAVLIAASIFDEGLKKIISAHLIDSDENSDPIFSGLSAPLSTFSAKIEISYRLGFIKKEAKEMLTLFRKIRNQFAHTFEVCSLNDASIKDRLNAIYQKQPDIYDSFKSVMLESISKIRSDIDADIFFEESISTRDMFNFIFAGQAAFISLMHLDVKKIEIQK